MNPRPLPIVDSLRSRKLTALMLFGLLVCMLLASCSSVDTPGSAQEVDPLAAVEQGMEESKTSSKQAEPANARTTKPVVDSVPGTVDKPVTAPVTQATRSQPKPQHILSDEQAAQIAIKLAQGKATSADKQALHVYLEASR